MKVKTTYVCEICGTEYQHQEYAELCESYGLPPELDYKPGDRVPVITRYDGIKWHTMVSKSVTSSHFTSISLRYADGEGESIEKYIKNARHTHEYYIVIDDEEQIGKEWYTDCIPMCNIGEEE